MLIQLLFFFIFLDIRSTVSQNYYSFRKAGENCELNDGSQGICRRQSACNDISKNKANGFKPCGFMGMERLYCCKPTAERAIAACINYVNGAYPQFTPLILGGNEAVSGQFPHMVALYYEDNDKYGKPKWACGGTLISDCYVLTAAHCLIPPILPTKIRVGGLDLALPSEEDESSFETNVANIIIHPKYNQVRSSYYDIGLIKTKDRVPFSQNVFPACLQTNANYNVSILSISGWGIAPDKPGNSKLLFTSIEEVALHDCINKWASLESNLRLRYFPRGIQPIQLCAAAKPGSKGDTCQGDSGGPVQYLWGHTKIYYVIGITSTGDSCGSKLPSVYTRISKFVPWIETFVWPEEVKLVPKDKKILPHSNIYDDYDK